VPKKRHPRRQTPAPIAREAKDILLKHLAAGLGGGFLASLGIDLPPIVEALPADIPMLEVRVEQLDSLYRTADGSILHIEFQMTSDGEDLRRFYRYNFAASEHYDADVYTVVFYGPRVQDAPVTLHRGSVTYDVRNVFVGQQDGEMVLTDLRGKLARNETLNDADLTRLKLLPLMAQSRPLPDVLAEAAALARVLSPALRDEVIGTMLGLAYNYLGQDIVDQLLGVKEMATALQKLVEDALIRGQAEGEAKSKHEDIVSFLVARFGPLSPNLQGRIASIHDLGQLQRLVIGAATASSLDAFTKILEDSYKA
jgi:hypothetical protein